MGRRTSSKTLPDDLLIKIMAMVPFPFIFKGRALSKSWQARFSQISSIDDEERKLLAISFQKQVGERSGSWKTFCPVYKGYEEVIAYDRTSRNWRTVPSLSFLPQDLLKGLRAAHIQEGALVFLFPWPEVNASDKMYVANVLTRSWKRLPVRPPFPNQDPFVTKLVRGTSIEVYNVVLLYKIDGADYLAQIYNSKSNTWSCNQFVIPIDDLPYIDLSVTPRVYLDGVLYFVVEGDLRTLLAINVQEGTMEKLEMPGIEGIHTTRANLVVCKGSVWIITYARSFRSKGMTVLKVDMAAGLLKVSDGPPAAACKSLFIFSSPVSDEHRILWNARDRRVLEYNVVENEWSILPFHGRRNFTWQGSPFQPGLNTFVAV